METKKMITKKVNIKKLIKDKSQVKLNYFEDEVYGQILKQSDKFILIREIKDWHFDGYIIFPTKYISSIKHGKLEKFREKVLNKKINFDLTWLDISSYKSIFKTLKINYNEIGIEGAEENVNQFVIGKIESFDKNNLYLLKLSPYAKFEKKEVIIPKKEITAIYFGDEYNTKLFEYSTK